MTDHEHAEVSRKLALAIGWKPEQFFTEHDGSYCAILMKDHRCLPYGWKLFDYRDPLVIWPIAERFNCFPTMLIHKYEWCALFPGSGKTHFGETAALAVARAVIASQEASQ